MPTTHNDRAQAYERSRSRLPAEETGGCIELSEPRKRIVAGDAAAIKPQREPARRLGSNEDLAQHEDGWRAARDAGCATVRFILAVLSAIQALKRFHGRESVVRFGSAFSLITETAKRLGPDLVVLA